MPLRIPTKVYEHISHWREKCVGQFVSKLPARTTLQAKRSFCNLLEQPEANVKAWLKKFDAVISDGDGVLWTLDKAIPGSPAVMQRFQQLGKRIYICTNNSTKTQQALCAKANQLGYYVTLDAMLCTAHATASYLHAQRFQQYAYLIGSNGVASELDAVGIEHSAVGPDVMSSKFSEYIAHGFKADAPVGAVIVAFDEHFSFVKLAKAATYLANAECLFLSTNTDEQSSTETKQVPGSGSFLRAVQTCTGREAHVIGKPNKEMCRALLEDGVLEPARTLMIGDNCSTDVLFGHNCGFQTLLVGTGKHRPQHVHTFLRSKNPQDRHYVPDVFLPQLGDLLRYMEEC